MTTNMQTIIAEAFEAGRIAERELIRIGSLASLAEINIVGSTLGGNGMRKSRVAKTSVASPLSGAGGTATNKIVQVTTAKPKTKTVTRGVRKESGPREKGVKNGVLEVIARETLTTMDIIAKTGFKESSVNGTLQGLKKAGRIIQDENKLWHPASSGNSGVDEQTSRAMGV